ncbi:hypothetical protein HXP44_23975 [Streptomyces sioyaensis]|uniref:Uncharacterized protein n=1 Tax=Streptomyces sioyaensis TaxID=67364 RepID=A0A4Q1QQS9_9ACTN|nr:hypothetical protein [Streptomyces sioyaensis]MBM4795034.1 hypothetical protein [Streptomyces sioyaensis]RXS58949.1 hypothetical protein EST54_31555 [Streptomyces sioyaensis]
MARQGRRVAAIDPGLPAGNRRLAEALRAMRPLLPPGLDTYTAIAAQAARDCNSERLSKATISRYFSGKLIAPGWFICWLHAEMQLGRHDGTPPPLEDLLTLQRSANNPTDCSGCNSLIKELGRSEAERLTATSRRWHLERALAECLDRDRRAGSGAGDQAHPASRRRPRSTLPVPYHRADRQDEVNDIRAADYITVRVSALASQQNHHEATATLSNAAAALPPGEVAAVVVSLRSREVDDEAETLLKGYARDQPANDIMSLACGLLKYGLFSDAEVLLRAAVK